MPTTPSGTVYTLTTYTSSFGETCRRGIADSRAADTDIPLLLFCHGNPGSDQTSADFQFTANYTEHVNWLMDNGWAFIEGHGAGANWGNSASRSAYRSMVSDMMNLYDIGWVVVLGRSMGNLVASHMAVRDTLVAPRCAGFISLSGTFDLTNRYSTASSTDKANLLSAYGAVDSADLATKVSDHDPLMFAPRYWDGKNAVIQYATGDTTVPPSNNALAWISSYSNRLNIFQTGVTSGGDHNSTPNDPSQIDTTLDFLALVDTPFQEPSPIQGTRIESVKANIEGVWSSVVFK